MKIGTKSVLFGVHQFAIHPWFVALGWWKLYGFPTQLWLWIAFFVHDIGYLGKPNMDGPEGEEHPWTGARIMYWLQGAWLFLRQPVFYERHFSWSPMRWWHLQRRWADAHLLVAQQRVIWGNEVLYHSRFLAKRYNTKPSRLCFADKLAFPLTPRWLYLLQARATGEIREYMAKSHHMNETGGKYAHLQISLDDQRAWHADVCAYVRRYVEEHRDGRDDSWTKAKVEGAASATGVYQ